ncbi:MAG: hypothetical protein ACREJU_15930 [Nitrospiraceae bacterium]
MMKNKISTLFLPALAVGILIAVMPWIARETTQGSLAPEQSSSTMKGTVDKITEYVLMQRAVAREGSYEAYLFELQVAKEARERGDWLEQYQSINRFIDKLDARAGGISARSAQDIREYTYLVSLAGAMM